MNHLQVQLKNRDEQPLLLGNPWVASPESAFQPFDNLTLVTEVFLSWYLLTLLTKLGFFLVFTSFK